MSKTYILKTAIIGATGYTGLDLVYILSKHPNVKILNLCATKNLGKKISFFDNRVKKKITKNFFNKQNQLEQTRSCIFIASKRGSPKNYKENFF